MMTVGDFWTWCVILAQEAGCRISSTFRSEEHNDEVGGKKGSWHKIGFACDFSNFPDAARRERLLFRAQKLFPFVLDEGDHIHAQGSN